LFSCETRTVTLMVYNVQNLFDDEYDGSEYREFDPRKGKWNAEFFRLRVDTIAEVVRKAAPGGADVLVLQEVENGNALNVLVKEGLRGMGYAHAIAVPREGSATNPAIVSRLKVTRVHCHRGSAGADVTPRDVLEAEIEANGALLHLFDNHWKSRIGGVRATEAARVGAAGIVAKRVREILLEDPSADVVVAGDFNESGEEFVRWGGSLQTALIPDRASSPPGFCGSSIFLAGRPTEAGIRDGRLLLYDPWLELNAEERGSYYGAKKWETFDHALLSPGLFDDKGFSYVSGSFRVFKETFLLDKEGAPKKWKGLGGQRGYSDHLPLLLRLHIH
jgi:endonuclease/exonuclease/phosphatase family metal-dependent hydrolase